MNRKSVILLSLLLFLFLGVNCAFAGNDPRLPKPPLVALYCPRNIDSTALGMDSGGAFPGTILNLPEAKTLSSAHRQPPHPQNTSQIDFGTVGDLTSLNFKTDSVFTPYLGARFQLSDPANSRLVVPKKVALQEKTDFLPYRLGFGFGCEVDKNLNLNLGYRVTLPAQFQYKDAFRGGLAPPEKGSEISLKLRLNF